VGEEVEEREEDGEGLLHAEEAVEGPFPMELDDFYISCDALVGDYVLAGVVAFCWAIPEKEAVEERDCCDMMASAIFLPADVDAVLEFREAVSV